jgi:hypothetical protein
LPEEIMNFRRPQARPPSFYWPDVGHGPETAGLHHRGPGGDGELRAMIVIYIFEENHRFSEKTPHPGPHSVASGAEDVLTERTSNGNST